ncbi:hypothetical protein RV11_GL000566 [Enterococcus phoeniculicola]|jgi:ubiquinone/menaquinone biosynthesis C-methylase UbiE|uniref:Methyltransferase domain-containing protein n=1 Tax=Enterococcus phoeniculicola ATCC BAA-412 TaxID=1158610 RepID=R3WFP0_9ENTE|nr:class I SAM-dependent methyltransferase [Enterococcus phoeniculicola]EOL46287.1 hypothetical protein UC3_01093 [Enterococcus phoeniculicola ATCC BAA-412]EOT76868.1 hypothetical protein I589_01829 [Enterococcus phoeniculicola ATCC BAA-412]OJG71276.1 hypothetical protein RV11_GL000566 [Enterococcus phoeniculicola]
MFYLFLFIFCLLSLAFLYRHLLNQSKKPSGPLGILMMKLWNTSYLPMVRWAISLSKNQLPSTVLDVGVGNGQSTAYLLSKLPTVDIVGIDISETATGQAAKNYSSISFFTMDVKETTFEDKRFELICAFQTHFHWSHLEEAFRELHRILADDGTILLASEKTKINYFLPFLKTTEQFQQFLMLMNLSIVTVNENTQWISYEIKKIIS